MVPTDDSNTIPPFSKHVIAGQTVTLTGVYIFTLSGSLTADCQQNGVSIPGLTGMSIDSTPNLFTPTPEVVVADLDLFSIVPDTVATPLGLAVAFQFEVVSVL